MYIFSLTPFSLLNLLSLLPHPFPPHSPPSPPSLLHPLAWQTWSIPVENATMALVTMHQQPVSAILCMKGSAVTVSQVSDTCGLTGTAWYSVMWQEVHVGVYRLLQCAYRLLTTWPCLDMPSLYTAMYTVNGDILLHKLSRTPPHFMHKAGHSFWAVTLLPTVSISNINVWNLHNTNSIECHAVWPTHTSMGMYCNTQHYSIRSYWLY